ncbi:LOW QUALITY PROTEIN: neurobeachin-like protein 2 [Rhineura floridana]|uniref:LOW QUALITY PROTEIN: neurobeachin-like protein 2 n=1 Tax=Rhineura floridana TaxID=261503 RepID=UPI002AC7FE6B|nr:LOW QUALITY PROTEIN: neurobeachin-like protein 2 [Rhineura floridana]
MASKERLYELWMLYFAKKDLAYLQQWLEAFVASFEKIIAVHSMEPRRPEDSISEIPLLPSDVLHVLTQQLTYCVNQISRHEVPEAGLNQALLLVKFFIIICRNLENVQTDQPPVFVHEVISLLAAYSDKLKNTQGQHLHDRSQLENITLYALHLYECLFDPYQTWRRQLSGEIISMKEKNKYKFAPAVLPQEFNSFFQECFEEGRELPEYLQLRLIHLLGAIISGAKQNALLVVTASSVKVLMLVLRKWCSPASRAPKDSRLLQLTLKSLVGMVHILHASSPSQRKVEIRAILDSYFKVLNSDQPMASLEGSPGPHWEERLIALRVNMLDAIPEMLNCDDRPVLQAIFLSNNCFEHIIRLIQNSKLYLSGECKVPGSDFAMRLLTEMDIHQVFDNSSDAIPIHAIGVLTSIMSNSPSAKEVFKERIGYSHLYEVLKSQSRPTRRLLQELLNMAVEGDHSSFPTRLIRNEQPLLILIMWIPELKSQDLQIFLSDWLKKICDSSLQSRMTCVKAGMVGCLLDALCAVEQELDRKCSENLIYLLQVLGSLSIRPGELRQLLKLLRTEPGKGAHPYTVQVIRALLGMARKDGPERALQYFDLTPSMAGIMVPSIQKWPGSGFAFHAWVCLVEEAKDFPEEAARLKRKQLYSFFTASGTGFEAFFTADGMLVVAVCTKKEYMTVTLQEFPFNNAAWHCVDVVHITGRRPFGQNLVNIYVDGQLRKVAQLRFPSLSESFTSCCIGSAGHRTTTTSAFYPSPCHSPDLGFPSHPSLSRSQSFPASLAPHSWTAIPPQPPREGLVSTTVAGSQDMEWGTPTSLEGHLGSVSIFFEALQSAQVKALFSSGPNVASPFKPEGDFQELSSRLLLYYTPQACKSNICLDLSPNHFFDGRLTGHKVVNWDVKDVVNCVGGMGVLLPLLDQVASQRKELEDNQETHDLVGPELTSSRNAQGMLIPLGKSSGYREGRLERNGVAAFLLLIKNFIHGHPVNQESLVQCQGPSIIGALLQKVSSQTMDMNVLMASQMLMEQVASEGHSFLQHLLYQFLLFDFRIWSNSDFAVRLGHIQYLSNIMKDHKQRVRKKYGVQYLLDSIRTYYGAYKEKPIATDDIKTVQTSLFSLIKEFFCKNFSTDEMQSTLNYLAAVNDEHQVCGMLEVIHGLQKSSPSQEQIYIFLFEPGNVEILFSLLVQRKFSDDVRERIFKILYKLLKYEKVNERSKHRLKLKDIGYQGFISYLNDIQVSMLLFRYLWEQVLGSDSPNYKDLVAVVYLTHRAELAVRLDICRKLFHLIYSQHDMVKQLAKLAGWQDTLTKLYVRESYESRQHSLSGSANGRSCPDVLKITDQPGTEIEKEGVDSVTPSATDLQDLDVFLPLGYEASDQELSEGFSDHSISPTSQRSKPFHPYGFKPFDSLDLASHSSSSNIVDIPGQGEAHAGDALQADRVYHPLSPFSMSPFDLGLDLGSTSSAATAESGNQTPVSLPGTPSPLESFKPFPGTRARKSSSLSNVLDETSYQETLPSDSISNTSNPQQTPEEELCNLLTNILFSVTWRGVEGWDDAAWKERGQVFSVLTKLGSACELVRPPDEIKRSLLEMMMESALTDIKESTPAMLPTLTQNALKLLRLLQDFLFSEGHNNQGLWSEKVYEGVNSLLDKLGVWYHLANGTSDLKEMAQIGLRVLIGYVMLEDLQLQSLAYVKLHSLLQTASAPKKEEACYLLGKLETPLQRSLHTKSETFSWLVPIVRTLMDQCYDILQLQHFLPSLPPTNGSPTFYEDFQVFCTTPEWTAFIEKHVQPTMAQFEMDTFAKSHDHMSNFWNSCYDALMSSSQRREKEKAESRRRFQELILEPVMKRAKHENIRHTNMMKQINNHQNTVLKQWKALRRLLNSRRSAWADRNPSKIHWKLSSAETCSRMRLKLVPNYNFDCHTEASALRDNLGADYLHNPEESLPLAVTKEAKVSEMQDDQLAEEDLSFLDNQVEPKEQSQKEKLVISEDCELITIVAVIPGRLEVTTQHIYFYDGSSEKDETEEGIGYDFKRPLSQLRELHLRRYNLRRSALEFFFIDQANYFLNFKKKVMATLSSSSIFRSPGDSCGNSFVNMFSIPSQVRNKVYSSILGLRPPNQIYFASRSPQDLLKASGLTQKWVYREISNFEYLMQLNTIAGRTYNDLSQYPVFPWILQDYVSETLDLSDPAVFRDLSKPIGVANERHAKDVKEKYESFEDPTGMIDKFHYGTHYSNAAGVMHYLIRTEPFTTLHIQLQSGKFDCSDRQFHSVPAAWQARMENPVDVKELIPEFFYFTDFLENQNGFDLGSLQISNEKVGDVLLPKWAKSPEDFIHKHRKALESEYVSSHLHEWIDLIFGYKQQGPTAVEALNVFYYCTYEGAVDLDAIADETQRKALEGIISNFGQTPCQLLKEPHPARLSAENASRRLSRLDTFSPNVFENLDQLKSFFVEGISDGIPLVQAVVPNNQAHSFMTQGSPDVLVTVSASGLLGTHGWLPYDKNISNYFSFTKDPTVSSAKTQRYLCGPFAPGVDVSSKTLAVSHDGKLLFSGGHWDNSLRVTSLSKGKVVGHINRHIDVVTCLALDLCGIYLISGSGDTTCMVWQVLQQGGFSCGLAPKPVQVLYGHDDEVTCVAISTELDMAVSGSKDGTIIVHTIRRGQFMKSLQPPCESSLPMTISNLTMGHEGQIVVQTTVEGRASLKDKFALHLYSINGKHLSSIPLDEQVTSMCVTEEFVVLGTAQCSLQIRDLQSLQAAVSPLGMKVPVHSVSVTKEKSHILVGLEDGKLIVVGAGQPSEVRTGQFHRRLWRSTRRISQVSSGETEYNPTESK